MVSVTLAFCVSGNIKTEFQCFVLRAKLECAGERAKGVNDARVAKLQSAQARTIELEHMSRFSAGAFALNRHLTVQGSHTIMRGRWGGRSNGAKA